MTTGDPAGRDGDAPLTAGRIAAAIAIGLAWIVGTATLVRRTELTTGQYISTGVPPLPAFGILMLLAVSAPWLRRRAPALAPTRAQILLIYAMATVGVVLSGLYHARAFLPQLTSLTYWSRPGSPSAFRLDGLARHLPGWWAPRDVDAIVGYHEGGGRVPWEVWWFPLACWSLFFLALFLGVHCAVALVRGAWMRDERLAFPLLTLPLALTEPSSGGVRGRGWFALGFGLAAAFDVLNIVHALWPSIPSPGFQISFDGAFPNRPWTPLQSMKIFFMIDAIGLGYFVPLDLSFSIWFFHLVNRAIGVAGTAAGLDQPGWPFTKETCAGGYMATALFLLWRLRSHAAATWRTAFAPDARSPESAHFRRAWIGWIASTLFVLGFCRAAGMSLWIAAPYFAIIGAMALVYARMRAETGVPFQFLYPFGQPRELLLNTLSVPTAIGMGGAESLVLLSSLGFLSNQHPVQEQMAYQLDARRLADAGRIPGRVLFLALALAFGAGLWAAWGAHLGAYHDLGSNLIPSAGGYGEYREKQARLGYEAIAAALSVPPPRDTSRSIAAVAGFAFAGFLGWLRGRWAGSPFHPLGFLVAHAFGDTSTSWFPMLVAWAAKAAILRAGGLALWKRGIPFFLGLVIGHFTVGGLMWPILTVFLPSEVGNAYHLLFGE